MSDDRPKLKLVTPGDGEPRSQEEGESSVNRAVSLLGDLVNQGGVLTVVAVVRGADGVVGVVKSDANYGELVGLLETAKLLVWESARSEKR